LLPDRKINKSREQRRRWNGTFRYEVPEFVGEAKELCESIGCSCGIFSNN